MLTLPPGVEAPALPSMSGALPVMGAQLWSSFPSIYSSYAGSAHCFLGCCIGRAEASEGSSLRVIRIDVKQTQRQHRAKGMSESDRAALPLLSRRPSERTSGSAGAAGWEE